MTNSPLPNFAAALLNAVRQMNAEATPSQAGTPTGLNYYGRHRQPAHKKPQTEPSWTQRIVELLKNAGYDVRPECNYPNIPGCYPSAKCDNVVTFEDGSTLWLENKGAWRKYWKDLGKLGTFHKHLRKGPNSAAHDIEKLSGLRKPHADYIGQLLIGFDEDSQLLERDVQDYCQAAGLSDEPWQVSSIRFPDEWRLDPYEVIRAWFFWRPTEESAPSASQTIDYWDAQAVAHPEDPVVLYNMGVAHSAAGSNDIAEAAYRVAMEIDPGYAAAHFNLGCTLLETDRAKEAKDEFETVTRLAPEMAQGHFMLGTALGVLGLPEQAIQATELGLRIEPESAGALFNIGTSHRRLGNLQDAISFIKRSLELDPENPAAHFELGKAFRSLGDLDQEITSYLHALQFQPMIDLWLHLGAAYAKSRRGNAFQVTYHDANGTLKLDDPNHVFYFSLGLLAAGMRSEAEQHLSALQKLDPTLAEQLERFIEEHDED
jgi:tetratricopeptide (TPR) repeat protein